MTKKSGSTKTPSPITSVSQGIEAISCLSQTQALPQVVKTAFTEIPLFMLPFFPSLLLGSFWFIGMSDPEKAWYLLLLFHSWVQPQPCFLPNDLGPLAAMLHISPEELKKHPIVLGRFSTTSDKKWIFNRKLLTEYLRSLKARENASRKGKIGASKRWNTQAVPTHGSSIVDALPDCSVSASASASTTTIPPYPPLQGGLSSENHTTQGLTNASAWPKLLGMLHKGSSALPTSVFKALVAGQEMPADDEGRIVIALTDHKLKHELETEHRKRIQKACTKLGVDLRFVVNA